LAAPRTNGFSIATRSRASSAAPAARPISKKFSYRARMARDGWWSFCRAEASASLSSQKDSLALVTLMKRFCAQQSIHRKILSLTLRWNSTLTSKSAMLGWAPGTRRSELQRFQILDDLHSFFFGQLAADHTVALGTVVEFMSGVGIAGQIGAERGGAMERIGVES